MNEQETHILHTYHEFIELGALEDVDAVDVDPDTAQAVLQARLDLFKKDIKAVYKTSKPQETAQLTKAALLAIMIEGGSNEEVYEFIVDNKLSTRHSVEDRREQAILASKKARESAIAVEQKANRDSELIIDSESARSLDDKLVELLADGRLSSKDQGGLRLLFGFVTITDPRVDERVVSHLKSSAAALIRAKLLKADKDKLFQQNVLATEGESVLYKMVSPMNEGPLTVPAIAASIYHDKDYRTKAPYSDDIARNQQMIETYISSTLDIIFRPSHEAGSRTSTPREV
jgi:hypothetical protein